MTPEELKEIEERCNKATPGPWRACHEGTCSCSQIWSQSADVPVAEITRGEWGDPGLPYGKIPEKIAENNSLFIAHAREDIPKLLSHIKELESQIPRWIPVEERLPENWVGVIVYSEEMGVLNNGWTVDGKWFDQTTILDDITHWMPLPEGPEE